MDAEDISKSAATRTATAVRGGTLEPVGRAAVAIARFQAPIEAPGDRYELRDPFAEVTYRSTSFNDITAKADQLGNQRVVAIDTQGTRTVALKVDGVWTKERRPDQPRGIDRQAAIAEATAAATASASASALSKETATATAKTTTSTPTLKSAVQSAATVAESIARIDAQAERTAQLARIEAALADRYLIRRAPVTVGDVTLGRTEYRFLGDTSRIAFTESTFKLATDTNSPSVARSMVEVAEARRWRALRVSGNEAFKRMVWLEASVRGVKTLGYEPNPGDREVLKKAREARLVNRIELERLDRGDGAGASATPADKASARGGGRKAVLAAIEAVLISKGVPEKQRAAVMAAATEKLAQRIRDGQSPKVKVYDKAAPSQRPIVVPTPEVKRIRERAAHVR
jgi:Large polyvalent protein-associated domain 7